ncbi:MAG: hypothetical protein ACOX54_00930 [Christensenellales bacterium]|jgi:hypothetical protein|nr:hypothetical protein [Christensenellaceae bacterium]
MGLLTKPVLKKFFTNKIESSRPEWGDYLLEIADIFSTFDGEDLDRELLTERFSAISGRSPYALRDISNFRDEFGAYGTYLGVFRTERIGNSWKIFLSNAAKHFLCSTEPDVESFCRTQLSLFQYPNGAGAVQNNRGTVHIQANIHADTVQEISNGIRVNPLRLLCRIVVALHEIKNVSLSDIHISYQNIFMLMNDDRINRSFSPNKNTLVEVLNEYAANPLPHWVTSGKNLTNFKRNFHIMERTGLFLRDRNGLTVRTDRLQKVYSYISTISEMTTNFNGFDNCYDSINIKDRVKTVVSSPAWGIYFDALTLPMQTLSALTDEIDDTEIILNNAPIGTIPSATQAFPTMRSFQANLPRTFVPSGNVVDPYETIVLREKANREHTRILNMLAATLRLRYEDVYENTFIDLMVNANEQTFIFEVKSNNSRNVLSQIRKAIAQLYEYRYRSKLPEAILCIVLQQKPSQEWVIDYLLYDRKILVCWMVDDVRLECPPECHTILAQIGILD